MVGFFVAHTSDVIAVVALLVAFASLIQGWRTSRAEQSLQERILKIEESRYDDETSKSNSARLFANLQKTGPTLYKLRIENAGDSAARNIKIELNGKDPSKHPGIPSGTRFPTTLGPSGVAEFTILITHQRVPLPWSIKMEWTDDTGDVKFYESELS